MSLRSEVLSLRGQHLTPKQIAAELDCPLSDVERIIENPSRDATALPPEPAANNRPVTIDDNGRIITVPVGAEDFVGKDGINNLGSALIISAGMITRKIQNQTYDDLTAGETAKLASAIAQLNSSFFGKPEVQIANIYPSGTDGEPTSQSLLEAFKRNLKP